MNAWAEKVVDEPAGVQKNAGGLTRRVSRNHPLFQPRPRWDGEGHPRDDDPRRRLAPTTAWRPALVLDGARDRDHTDELFAGAGVGT
jgi:hypothetical protein